MSEDERRGSTEKAGHHVFADKDGTIVGVVDGEEVNASGHKDQLQRQYSIWSLCGLALTIDNAWIALGGSLVIAIGG
jgi:choline transport protein